MTSNQPSVGTKLEGLLLDDLEDDFNPRAFEPQPNNRVITNNLSSGLFNGNSTSPPSCELICRAILLFFFVLDVKVIFYFLFSVSPPPKEVPTSRPRPHASNGHGTNDLFNVNSFIKQNAGGNNLSQHGNALGSTDLFGMDDFAGTNKTEASQQDLENAIGILDKRLLEMKVRR